MLVKDLIEKLSSLNPESFLHCQVVGNDHSAWNMWLRVEPVKQSDMVVLQLYHPDLESVNPTVRLKTKSEGNYFDRENA